MTIEMNALLDLNQVFMEMIIVVINYAPSDLFNDRTNILHDSREELFLHEYKKVIVWQTT